jgi:hypothetical protein
MSLKHGLAFGGGLGRSAVDSELFTSVLCHGLGNPFSLKSIAWWPILVRVGIRGRGRLLAVGMQIVFDHDAIVR